MPRITQRIQTACLVYVSVGLVGCSPEHSKEPSFDPAFYRLSPLQVVSLPLATSFEAPMGTENGAMTYNAQPFRRNRHLGDDLNGIGGYNSDLGDPVYASGDGQVIYAREAPSGWGKMVILAHRVPDPKAPQGYEVIQTVYAHLDQIDERAKVGNVMARGDRLGSVGTANGEYWAHLHFEIRKTTSINPSVGYSDSPMDRISPLLFLKQFAPTEKESLSPSLRKTL